MPISDEDKARFRKRFKAYNKTPTWRTGACAKINKVLSRSANWAKKASQREVGRHVDGGAESPQATIIEKTWALEIDVTPKNVWPTANAGEETTTAETSALPLLIKHELFWTEPPLHRCKYNWDTIYLYNKPTYYLIPKHYNDQMRSYLGD